MNPQQKHAVLVMIESIEHQLAAVKTLLASQPFDDGRPINGGHKSSRMPVGGIQPFLDEDEEDELEEMLDPSKLQATLEAAMKATESTPAQEE